MGRLPPNQQADQPGPQGSPPVTAAPAEVAQVAERPRRRSDPNLQPDLTLPHGTHDAAANEDFAPQAAAHDSPRASADVGKDDSLAAEKQVNCALGTLLLLLAVLMYELCTSMALDACFFFKLPSVEISLVQGVGPAATKRKRRRPPAVPAQIRNVRRELQTSSQGARTAAGRVSGGRCGAAAADAATADEPAEPTPGILIPSCQLHIFFHCLPSAFAPRAYDCNSKFLSLVQDWHPLLHTGPSKSPRADASRKRSGGVVSQQSLRPATGAAPLKVSAAEPGRRFWSQQSARQAAKGVRRRLSIGDGAELPDEYGHASGDPYG